MLNIIVCIKQVPGTTQVEIDPKTGVLKRSAAAAKMNPYDLYAIETAMVLKEKYGADTTALTMGPPYSEAVLREAFMLGIDHGVLLTDRAFGGADCLATSYALSQAIKALGIPDLVLCGKQTTDGDTAQVGPELSEWLNLPAAVNVIRFKEVKDSSFIAEIDLGSVTQVIEIQKPCLMTVEKDIFEPRLPSYKKKVLTKNIPIRTLTLKDMQDQDLNHYGLNGSPTRVVKVFPPVHDTVNEVWQGSPDETAGRLADLIIKNKFA